MIIAPTALMWKYDHAEQISLEEYNYWRTHTLPFGWSVIEPPDIGLPDAQRVFREGEG